MIATILLLVGFSGLLAVAIPLVIRKGVNSPKFHVNPELPAPEPARIIPGAKAPLAITADVRKELDSTPEWWDEQFHKALEASGEEAVDVIEGDIIIERVGGSELSYHSPDIPLYDGCLCRQCQSAGYYT